MQRTMLATVQATDDWLIALPYVMQISAHLAFSYTKCTVGFVKHMSPYTGCIAEWIWCAFSLFAHKVIMMACCSLRDNFSANVKILNVYKWRHSDVIVMKITGGTRNEIPHRTYISDFSYFRNYWNGAIFKTYLLNDPRTRNYHYHGDLHYCYYYYYYSVLKNARFLENVCRFLSFSIQRTPDTKSCQGKDILQSFSLRHRIYGVAHIT